MLENIFFHLLKSIHSIHILLTLPLVSLPTMYGEMKPGQHPNRPLNPRITPEKLGLPFIWNDGRN